eukprot:scaffold279378_cov41-Prasinocladus_malaysianus.AAC.1
MPSGNSWSQPVLKHCCKNQSHVLQSDSHMHIGGVHSMSTPPEVLDLQVVTKRTLSIHCLARGIHEFVSLGFDVANLACVKMSVHSVLLGFSHGSRGSREETKEQAGLPTSTRPQARGSVFDQGEADSSVDGPVDAEEPRTPDATQRGNGLPDSCAGSGAVGSLMHTLPRLELVSPPKLRSGVMSSLPTFKTTFNHLTELT